MPMGILAACITSHMQVCTASALILMERSAADVHVLLGDIGLEEERFDSSAIDYESALKLLMQKLEVGKATNPQYANALRYDLLNQRFIMSTLPCIPAYCQGQCCLIYGCPVLTCTDVQQGTSLFPLTSSCDITVNTVPPVGLNIHPQAFNSPEMHAVQADDRHSAEVHYKLALTLHPLKDFEKALIHANKAVARYFYFIVSAISDLHMFHLCRRTIGALQKRTTSWR